MAEIKRRSEAFNRVVSPQRMMAMSASDNTRLADLRIAEVKPDPGNPRKEFDEAELAALAGSLRKHGLLQPIVVRKVENDYIILAGERRWRAAQLAEFVSIKAVIHTDSRSAANVLVAQIIENEQRSALSTSELVLSIARLLAEGLGVQEIADELTMNRTRVSKLKALTELPEELQPFLTTMGIDPLYEMLQQHRANAGSLKTAIETGKAPTRAELREAKRSPVASTVPPPPLEAATRSPRIHTSAPSGEALAGEHRAGSPAESPAEQPFAGERQPDKTTSPTGEAFAGERRAGSPAASPAEQPFAGERQPDKPTSPAGEAFAGERRSKRDNVGGASPAYRDQGSITVSHPGHGEGRVVFGIASEGDRLLVLFTNAPEPIPILLTELTIVSTD